MVTKEQAVNAGYRDEFHFGNCHKIVGPKGGVTIKIETWRVNGRCATWKRDPERFELPIKYGLKTCSYLTNRNAGEFHRAKDCPLLNGGEENGINK